jgi:hypothetical protein
MDDDTLYKLVSLLDTVFSKYCSVCDENDENGKYLLKQFQEEIDNVKSRSESRGAALLGAQRASQQRTQWTTHQTARQPRYSGLLEEEEEECNSTGSFNPGNPPRTVRLCGRHRENGRMKDSTRLYEGRDLNRDCCAAKILSGTNAGKQCTSKTWEMAKMA